MEYRISEPDDYDCEDEDEEFDVLSENVQDVMQNTGKDEMSDMMLIYANICEVRAVMNSHVPKIAAWYATAAKEIRRSLDTITSSSDTAFPNQKLENPLLYYQLNPDDKTH